MSIVSEIAKSFLEKGEKLNRGQRRKKARAMAKAVKLLVSASR